MANFDPRAPAFEQYEDYEELYPKEDKELSTVDAILFAVRCITVFFALVSIVLVLVNIARGQRLKSWRLYFLTSLSVFSWLSLTLYQDYIDEFFVQEVTRYPQPRSIYYCFRNFLHGFTLYLILLLLAHLSDLQHRCSWFGFIAAAILVPLSYSVGILIADLRVDPKARYQWFVTIAVDSIRVALYNVATTILLFAMSRSFCTSRLYGTYSEKRSKVVVIVARWTFAMLLLHNLVTMAHYAINVVIRIQDIKIDTETFVLVGSILHEILLFVITLSVPFSYLVGLMSQCCCGVSSGTEMEMDKVDKIYTDVWTTPSIRSNGETAVSTRPTSATSIHSNTGGGLQNGVVARRHGSNSTLSSEDSFGQLPRITTNPGGNERRKRESYMEAVSMGSLNEDRNSITSHPVEI